MTFKLSDICTFADGRIAVADLDLTSYISTENMLQNKEGITRSAGLPTVNQTQAYQAEDVLVSNIRPYFRKIWYADRDGGCSNDVLVFRAKENVYPSFLYYLLSDDAFFDYATATAKGTKMPRGDKGAIMRYEVPDLPLDIQIGIADTLAALDARIAENRAINHHLEQMAQAILSDMFGSMLLRQSTEIMGKYLNFINGFAFKSTTYLASGKYKIITIKNVQDGLVDSIGTSYIDVLPARMHSDCILSIGDILLSLTGNVGRVGIVSNNNLLLNQRVAKIVPKSKKHLPFWYFVFRSSEIKEHLIRIAKGTAQQNLSPIETLNTKISLDLVKVEKYVEVATPLFNNIVGNMQESARLAELRDSLLPKLMSGELSFSDLSAAK